MSDGFEPCASARPGLRLGLCRQFAREPIKFRTTTATAMGRLPRPERLARLAELCCRNAQALFAKPLQTLVEMMVWYDP